MNYADLNLNLQVVILFVFAGVLVVSVAGAIALAGTAMAEGAHDVTRTAGDALACWRAASLLCARDDAFFNIDDNGEPILLILCNDTFGYACADCEEVPLDQAPMLLELRNREGWPGLIRWIAERRGCDPIPPVIEKMKQWKPPAAELAHGLGR